MDENELNKLFEEYWKDAPLFPIPEEHARHKIAASTAFFSGFLEGFKFSAWLRKNIKNQ